MLIYYLNTDSVKKFLEQQFSKLQRNNHNQF